MIVYHGSTEIIKKPDVIHSKKYLDFGMGFYITSFEKENDKWLDFVCACRKGNDINREYDIIIGNVADDDVFKTVDMYFRGLWDKKKVLDELRYYKMNNQICIVNQKTLDKVLKFKKAYEVDKNDR